MINIRYEHNELIVRIPKNLASSDYVQRLLEYLRLEATLEKSEVSDSEIENLSEEIKAEWWARNKDIFLAGRSE